MRSIDRAAVFKWDDKRARASPRHRRDVDALVLGAVELSLADGDLPETFRDHALIGNWSGYRE